MNKFSEVITAVVCCGVWGCAGSGIDTEDIRPGGPQPIVKNEGSPAPGSPPFTIANTSWQTNCQNPDSGDMLQATPSWPMRKIETLNFIDGEKYTLQTQFFHDVACTGSLSNQAESGIYRVHEYRDGAEKVGRAWRLSVTASSRTHTPVYTPTAGTYGSFCGINTWTMSITSDILNLPCGSPTSREAWWARSTDEKSLYRSPTHENFSIEYFYIRQ